MVDVTESKNERSHQVTRKRNPIETNCRIHGLRQMSLMFVTISGICRGMTSEVLQPRILTLTDLKEQKMVNVTYSKN